MKVINDLYDYENLKIVQDTDFFKFSLDSILLAEIVDNVDNSKLILDLCAGNGAVDFILSYYLENKIYGFEIQKKIYDLAIEGLKLNGLEKQIEFIHDDVKNIKNYFPGNNFDVIVANPPYFKVNNNAMINENNCKAMARHEITLDLESIFQVTAFALKSNGQFYLVHRPERLEEILYLCEKYGITAKKVCFVYTKSTESANMVLLKCIKGANSGLTVYKPIFVQDYNSYKNIFRG